MGVLQRFERRLGGLVEGAFAKVFKGGVEPVEIASALARETDDRRAVSSNRVLVPNEFAVELASGDFARLSPYQAPLCDELASMVREHAAEQRYTFVGPVSVRLSEAGDLDVGVFRIRSSVASADPAAVGGRRPVQPRPPMPGTPRLVITSKSGGPPSGGERDYPLEAETTVIGRSVECDIRLNDTGVSRRHGEIRRTSDGQFLYVDAGSTNGSIVNGRPATQVKLVNGDRIELGGIILTFRRDDGRGDGRSVDRSLDRSADRGAERVRGTARVAPPPGDTIRPARPAAGRDAIPDGYETPRPPAAPRGGEPVRADPPRGDRYGDSHLGRERDRARSGRPEDPYRNDPRRDPRRDDPRRPAPDPYRGGREDRGGYPAPDPYRGPTGPRPASRQPEPDPRSQDPRGGERPGRGVRGGADPYGGYGASGYGGSGSPARRGYVDEPPRGGQPGRRQDDPPVDDDLYDAQTYLPGRMPPPGQGEPGERPRRDPGPDRRR